MKKEVQFMDLGAIIARFQGVNVAIVTTNSATPIAYGEVLSSMAIPGTLSLKLTQNYDGLPAGATVFFNINQIVSIG